MPGYLANAARSADGTTIGYRQYGSGPGLILVHGGMQAAQHLSVLAAALASQFQVLVPDRRGRGSSGPHGTGSGLRHEVQDLQALIAATGARFLFGHSSGALIALRAALVIPAVERAALYEPPLSVRGSAPASWVPRFHQEIAAGKNAAATVTALKGARLDPALTRLPRWLLTPIAAARMRDRNSQAATCRPLTSCPPCGSTCRSRGRWPTPPPSTQHCGRVSCSSPAREARTTWAPPSASSPP